MSTEPTAIAQQKISLIESDAQNLRAQIESLAIVDDETNAKAADYLKAVKTRQKRVDELRKELTQPLYEQQRKINNMFKPQLDYLTGLESALKGAMGRYMDEQERKAREEAERLRKEQEEKERLAAEEAERIRKEAEKEQDQAKKEELEQQAKETEEAPQNNIQVAEAAPTTVRTENTTVSRKKVWTFEVVDEKILREKHPEFFVLDTKAVNKFVQETREEKMVDGLRLFQKTEIAAR